MSLSTLVSEIDKEVKEKAEKDLKWCIKYHGPVQDEAFALSIIENNLAYKGRWTPEVFNRVQAMQAKLEAHAQIETPLPGHLVFTDTDRYNCAEAGILEEGLREWEDGLASVCKNGSCHVSGFRNTPIGNIPSMSISDGHFFGVNVSELTPLDFYTRQYWMWGDGARANGGIYFDVAMRRWKF